MLKPTTKFLIVDDSLVTRKMHKNTLIRIGFNNFVDAADGEEAFKVLLDCAKTSAPIEFIISDWNMPNMLGIDFLKKCRAEKSFQALPFLFITVESEPSQILEAGLAGVTEYLVKPFNSDTLKIKIENAFKKINKLS